MQQWEYKETVHFIKHSVGGTTSTYDVLNSVGEDGWELVTLIRERTDTGVSVMLYWKRPKK